MSRIGNFTFNGESCTYVDYGKEGVVDHADTISCAERRPVAVDTWVHQPDQTRFAARIIMGNEKSVSGFLRSARMFQESSGNDRTQTLKMAERILLRQIHRIEREGLAHDRYHDRVKHLTDVAKSRSEAGQDVTQLVKRIGRLMQRLPRPLQPTAAVNEPLPQRLSFPGTIGLGE